MRPQDLDGRSIYGEFRRWRREDVWTRLMAPLRHWERQWQGRLPEPSAGCADSQSIKTATQRQDVGFDGNKKVVICRVLICDLQGKYEPQAFLATHVDHPPLHILTWFVQRGRMEVTFEEARSNLGIETQRQWSDVAIARSTTVSLGLLLLVTLMADCLHTRPTILARLVAWYRKSGRPSPMRWCLQGSICGVAVIFQRQVKVVVC